ncbi:hypothetical protein [Streptomyces kronopolitis]|uniref:hypothetical protein n=1 Tax=Streptomyces kronopolitis TaxID=1612435 RepID=UPI003D9558BB
MLRADGGTARGGMSKLVRGARAVVERALLFSGFAPFARLVLVNGAPGLVTAPGGGPLSVMGFTLAHGKVVEINILAEPARLRRLDLTFLDDGGRAGEGPFGTPALTVPPAPSVPP